MRSITPSDCILHLAISARCSSRINTPCRRSNQQLDPVHPQGRTPTPGPEIGPPVSVTHGPENTAEKNAALTSSEMPRPVGEFSRSEKCLGGISYAGNQRSINRWLMKND